MRGMARSHRWILAGLAMAAAGCVASIHEERLYGAPRPRSDGPPDVIAERRQGNASVMATVHKTDLDVTVRGTTECRDVEVTSRVRDVSLRRSFADAAQETNGAAAMLLGAGAGFLQYSAEQINCPGGSACWSAMISAEYGLLALAAIPLGFVVFNALRVRDGRALESAAPEVREGPWRRCASEPLAGESIAISIGGIELVRTTDREGHAGVDLAALAAQAPAETLAQALIRHAGSRDLVVDLKPVSPGDPR